VKRNNFCPEAREGKAVLRAPLQKFSTALVGHGLTAAAQVESPTVGLGAETGERVAKLAPLHRTAGGSTWLRRAVVKDHPGWARSVHQRADIGIQDASRGLDRERS
jgi:hypothetical protein